MNNSTYSYKIRENNKLKRNFIFKKGCLSLPFFCLQKEM